MIHNSVELLKLIDRIGTLLLLNNDICSFSAKEMIDDDCRIKQKIFPM